MSEVEGRPYWRWECWRTQGLNDDTYYIYDEEDRVVGIGDTFDEALKDAEQELQDGS
jgi:hypothetical protein